jgi:hypothetical protein
MTSQREKLNEAFDKAVSSMSRRDMPLLLYGSGDVPPDGQDPDAVRLVSALTVQYVAELVDAAIDAREMLLDISPGGPVRTTSSRLPPTPLPNHRKPPPPSSSSSSRATAAAKRKRASEEFWDEPLPEPKIRGKPHPSDKNKKKPGGGEGEEFTGNSVKVPPEEWVGAAGVDLLEGRCRSAYVRGPTAALGTSSFLFPICHDVYTYGRVRDLRTAKRTTVAPLLQDPVLAEVVRTEGRDFQQEQRRKHKPMKKKKEKDIEDPDEEDDAESEEEEDEEDGPRWPGLEGLLPFHREGDE